MMEELQQVFIRAVAKQRLGHAYILEGMQGVGKHALAIFIAKLLFCQKREISEAPCEQCAHCKRISDGNYPDIMEVKPDGASIKVEQIRELKQLLSKTAMESAFKVCILHDVDLLTTGAANSLLKFLEEPESPIVFLLLTSRLSKVLPTIQSRCQMIHLQAPMAKQVSQRLIEQGVIAPVAQLVAELTSDETVALDLAANEDFLQLRQESWQWFVRVFQNRAMAFVTLQTQLLPYIATRDQGQRFLELLTIYVRDALYVAMDLLDNVLQADRLTTLKIFATRYSVRQWISIYEQTIQLVEKVQANVGLQAAIEQWILQLPK